MSDPQTESLSTRLLQQDAALHAPCYEEHRMELERKLAQAESRERLTKRAVVGAILVAAALFPLLASQALGSPDPTDKNATVFSIAAAAVYTLAWVVVFIGVASYYSRFLPRLRRAREELQQESIRELRREIHELRELLIATRQGANESGRSESESGGA